MTPLEELRSIYETYETKLAKVISEAPAFAGVFGTGEDPRKDACNPIFYENVQKWVDSFTQTNPASADAQEAAAWILGYSAAHKKSQTYWFTVAAQKHAGALIPFLTQSDAAVLIADFRRQYPREKQLPVQEEIITLLSKASAEKVEKKPGFLEVWGVRVILLLVGLTIAHLGVTLFLLADLGSDPFNVMIQGLQRMIADTPFALSHGTVHVIISMLIILVLLIVDKSYVRIGTFLCMILGGPIIDLFNFLLGSLVNSASPMAIRVIAVILGCGILAFGMTIVIKSEAGTGPNDLVAVVISDKGKWKFGMIRILVDISFAGIGFVLGGTVGLGTIICVAVVGPVAQIFMPFSQKLCGRFLK